MGEDQLGARFYSGVGRQVQVKRLAGTLAPHRDSGPAIPDLLAPRVAGHCRQSSPGRSKGEAGSRGPWIMRDTPAWVGHPNHRPLPSQLLPCYCCTSTHRPFFRRLWLG